MGHGPSILELTKEYEKRAKGFKAMTHDILTNRKEYCGVINFAENFDLLVVLHHHLSRVFASFLRGWPAGRVKPGLAGASHHTLFIELSKALEMFPEIKKATFLKEGWPEPYKPQGKGEPC